MVTFRAPRHSGADQTCRGLPAPGGLTLPVCTVNASRRPLPVVPVYSDNLPPFLSQRDKITALLCLAVAQACHGSRRPVADRGAVFLERTQFHARTERRQMVARSGRQHVAGGAERLTPSDRSLLAIKSRSRPSPHRGGRRISLSWLECSGPDLPGPLLSRLHRARHVPGAPYRCPLRRPSAA